MNYSALQSHLYYLTEQSRLMLQGCRTPAENGVQFYTPDRTGGYRALWLRDFTYMVQYAGDLIPLPEMEACVRTLLNGQNMQGNYPDRVNPDGRAIYAAGPENNPMGKPNLDNSAFMVILADEFLRRIDPAIALTRFHEWAPALERGLACVPLGAGGLVYNDPNEPHSPYGFTDTIGKTGDLLFESLLFWDALRRLAQWYERAGDSSSHAESLRRGRAVETGLDALWDTQTGAFFAASLDCRQIDIWGNAFAIATGFPLGDHRARLLAFLVENAPNYLWNGQVRHLLRGEHWQRILEPMLRQGGEPSGTYQNGAYWGTATSWVLQAFAEANPGLMEQTISDLVAYYRDHGIYECVNAGYQKLEGYVASVTNPRGALMVILQKGGNQGM